MSFSTDCKQEICTQPLEKNCCCLSEICGLYHALGKLSLLGRGKVNVQFTTENYSLARYIYVALRKLLGVSPQLHYVTTTHFGGRRKCVLTLGPIYSPMLLEKLQMMRVTPEKSTLLSTSPYLPISKNCCIKSYVRGILLGSGYIMNPEKGYHAEIIYNDNNAQAMLTKCFQRLSLPIKKSVRRDRQYLYLKKGDDIISLLGNVGATKALMKIEDIRVKRQLLTQINRAMNCDNFNLQKRVNASKNQYNIIQTFSLNNNLEQLPPALFEIAKLRLQAPDATLIELGQMMNPPLSKSAINHRLRRLIQYINEHTDANNLPDANSTS